MKAAGLGSGFGLTASGRSCGCRRTSTGQGPYPKPAVSGAQRWQQPARLWTASLRGIAIQHMVPLMNSKG